MRKDKLSSYQAKKEKLKKIKKLIEEMAEEIKKKFWPEDREETLFEYRDKLWEIVKDE